MMIAYQQDRSVRGSPQQISERHTHIRQYRERERERETHTHTYTDKHNTNIYMERGRTQREDEQEARKERSREKRNQSVLLGRTVHNNACVCTRVCVFESVLCMLVC
jgi:hypothetical protein